MLHPITSTEPYRQLLFWGFFVCKFSNFLLCQPNMGKIHIEINMFIMQNSLYQYSNKMYPTKICVQPVNEIRNVHPLFPLLDALNKGLNIQSRDL